MNNTLNQVVAIQAVAEIQAHPEIAPWRIFARALHVAQNGGYLKDVPLCPDGGHDCNWEEDGNVLICRQCGLDCT